MHKEEMMSAYTIQSHQINLILVHTGLT